MFSPRGASWVLSSYLLVHTAAAYAAPGGFNPRGRVPPKTKTSAPSAQPLTKRSVSRARAKKLQRDTPEQQIAHYRRVLVRQPGAALPLERLVQLHRQTDGSADQLIADYEAQSKVAGAKGFAAKLNLAGLYLLTQRLAQADELLAKLVASRPEHPRARELWANRQFARGEARQAIETLQAALPHAQGPQQRDEFLQKLVSWALQVRDFALAEESHKHRVRLAKNSFYVRASLGREMMAQRLFPEAEHQFRRLVESEAGDPRTLYLAVQQLATAQVEQLHFQEVIATLSRWTPEAAPPAIRRQLDAVLTQAYRGVHQLPKLVALRSRSQRQDSDHFLQLGQLYEELGQLELALSTLERAVRARPDDIEARQALVELLLLQGELARTLPHRQRLARQQPKSPYACIDLVDVLYQLGQRDRALDTLRHFEPHIGKRVEAALSIASVYEKLDAPEQALRLLQQLAKNGAPQHLTELGERYFAAGRLPEALRTWQRIAPGPRPSAKQLHRLGKVYFDHDLVDEAVTVLERAHEQAPNNWRYARQLALALERSAVNAGAEPVEQRFRRRAEELWQRLSERAVTEGQSRRASEARQHLVNLWSHSRSLEEKVPLLRAQMQGEKPNISAGKLLADVLIRQRRYPEATRALRSLAARAPGDFEVQRTLERVLVLQGHFEQALHLLEELANNDPQSAPQYYETMASHAEKLYRDDLSLQYAEKAAALAPSNPQAQLDLAARYRARNNSSRATQLYRTALQMNPQLLEAHLQLAELLIEKNDPEQALGHLRQVIRLAPDDQLLTQASSLARSIAVSDAMARALESELLGLAVSSQRRSVYREELLALYTDWTSSLQRRKIGTDEEAAATANGLLGAIGKRALKPLLDTVTKGSPPKQAVALSLLETLGNDAAGPALVEFAKGDAAMPLRQQAMRAVGTLRSPALVPELEKLLWPASGLGLSHEGDPVRSAAAWAVSRTPSLPAKRLLHRLLDDSSPTIQTLAVVGLEAQYTPSDASVLTALAQSKQRAPITRVAAIVALARHGDQRQQLAAVDLTSSRDPIVSGAALAALALMNSSHARVALAQGLLHGAHSRLPLTARAACALHRAPVDTSQSTYSGQFPYTAAELLEAMLPPPCSEQAAESAVVELEGALAEALLAASKAPPQEIFDIGARLRAPSGEPLLVSLTPPTAQTASGDSKAVAQRLVTLFTPAYETLARHPNAGTRRRALQWLTSDDSPSARKAALVGLRDPDETVRTAALTALEKYPNAAAAPELTHLLLTNPSWTQRRSAARSLGATAVGGSIRAEVAQALRQAAELDPFAMVRNDAMTALHRLSPKEALSVLEKRAQSDVEPEVRKNARKMLGLSARH